MKKKIFFLFFIYYEKEEAPQNLGPDRTHTHTYIYIQPISYLFRPTPKKKQQRLIVNYTYLDNLGEFSFSFVVYIIVFLRGFCATPKKKKFFFSSFIDLDYFIYLV